MKIFLTACAFLFTINPLAANADISLKFGVYTSDKPTTMVKMFRPILNILEQEMTKTTGDNVKISLHVAKNYDQGINDLVSGKVDFARMGPASFITSKELNPDLQLLAMESKKGEKVFYGIICVQDQSPITHISQLKGHSFAFGSKRSTIGRYLSQHLLSQQGIFAKDLKTYDYLGRHDRVGSAVGAGQFDAGALKESTFKKLIANGTKIREINKFPNVTKPWIANSNMNKKIFFALKQSLLELSDKNALRGIKKQGFLPATDSDYNIIRESMANNAIFFKN